MKFSESWLREWVNPDISRDELCHQLTMAGLEVDAVEPVAGEFSKVVVAEVLSLEKHPDADKLNVCQVNIGGADPVQIVCGAANVHAGMKAPAALIGAKLPGDFKIKKSKLRGVESHGMLCSTKELGLAESADGLMPLPADAPVGTDMREYLQLNDVIIELGLTPNRADCLSIQGIAREVGVLNRQAMHSAEFTLVKKHIDDEFPVKLQAGADCPRYAGRIIRGINQQAETPLWMVEKLRRSGIRSLDPVVDVTNYVLLELGQPMHAFDLERLQGAIVVRHASEGETLTLLNDEEVTLSQGTLVIADEKQPLALAGIMGGADSAVSDSTRDIFLEAAHFNPAAIAGRARSYGLHTDSSHRFERGVSADLPDVAIERATQLIISICGGQAGPVVTAVNEADLPQRQVISLREERIGRVLGVSLERSVVQDILKYLDMAVTETTEGWNVTPPAFRFDIEREEDLIEEIGRIYGYDNLPVTRPRVDMAMGPVSESRVPLARYRQHLVDLGYQEAITYSFVEPEMQKLLDPDCEALALANPISSELSVMRSTLWPGLVQALKYNLNRQQSRVCLFECGLRFVPQGHDIKQELVISGLICGRRHPEHWALSADPVDFYDIKHHVEVLLAQTGRQADFSFEKAENPVLHPGQSAQIRDNGLPDAPIVGWLGALHPALERRTDVNQRVYLFEISSNSLESGRIPAYTSLSRYPAIRRDIAIVVDEAITASEVEQCVRNTVGELLSNFELFDVYRGEGIDSGRKSLALGLTLQDLSRTLTDTEVETEINQVLETLASKLGATLRE